MLGVIIILLIVIALLVVSFAVPGGVVLAVAGLPLLIGAVAVLGLIEGRHRR